MKRTVLAWSSGKDSAYALGVLRRDPAVELVGLLTTVNQTHDRVAMHAVRRAVLEAQARSVGLPLDVVELPWPCPNEIYEANMRAAIERVRARGVTHMAFGDLFLEDVRRYREEQLAQTGIAPLFPLWGRDTAALARAIVAEGFEAVLTCVDPRKLDASFAGRRFDAALLDALPPGVDPCGENGEFHSCVLSGPGFSFRVAATVGETVTRDGFVFADLLPA